MNYEKKYKEALERAKDVYTYYCDDREQLRKIESIFPELRKSEDEKIKEELITLIQGYEKGCYVAISPSKIKEFTIWLEKQGEMDMESYKAAEDEKREFVGDGFIKCYADFQDFKEGETYWLEYVGNDNYNVRSDNLLGKTYHVTPCQLYTIFKKQTWLEKQGEQKPNPYSGTLFEYNGHTWGMCARDNGVDILCDKHLIGHLEKQGESYTKRDVDDAWLKGMCDAKRELEKQNDTNIFDVPKISIKDAIDVTSRMQYIEDDMKPIADFVIDYASWNLHKDEWNQPVLEVPLFRVLDALIQRGKPYCECSQNIEKQGEQKPVIEMKSAEESLGIDSETYNKIVDECIYDEQKPTWSEEDEEYINDLIGVFDGQQYQAHSDEEIVKWLKSIRLPYNKEWDENDEEMLRSIIATCELAEQDRDSSPARHLLEMQLNWLKSLKTRYTWKPSDEQLEALKNAIHIKPFENPSDNPLWGLYEQLKKLIGG